MHKLAEALVHKLDEAEAGAAVEKQARKEIAELRTRLLQAACVGPYKDDQRAIPFAGNESSDKDKPPPQSSLCSF